VDADPSSLDARYFLGICHLLTGDIEPGIAELRQVIDAGSASPYAEEAHFYLAKAHLQQGNFNQARAELEKVAAQKGDLHQQAREILNRLPPQ
jgi:TolA-binding protein